MPHIAASAHHHHILAAAAASHHHLAAARAAESAGAPTCAATRSRSATAALIGSGAILVSSGAIATLITLRVRLSILSVLLIAAGGVGCSKVVRSRAEAKCFRYAQVDAHKAGPLSEVARYDLFARERSRIERAEASHDRSWIARGGERRPILILVIAIVVAARFDVERRAGACGYEWGNSQCPWRGELGA